MDKWKAQDTYWNSFGLAAYNELTVPETAMASLKKGDMIITYQAATGSLDGGMLISADVYHRSNSWSAIMQKVSAMEPLIDRQIPIDGGAVKIRKPLSNFAQPMEEPNDPQVRRIHLMVEMEFLSE